MKRNVYLDCGGHHGEGLMEFIEKYGIDKSWVIETFEPNPACNYKERVKNLDLNITIHEKAVWVYDGIILFSQENHEKSNSKSPTDGNSKIDGWGSVISEIGSRHLLHCEPPIEVECVNFNEVLSKYNYEEHNVIVKLDIEGAEYNVLRHIILNGSIKNINELYVEWHHVDLENENINTTNKLIETMKSYGVIVHNWK